MMDNEIKPEKYRKLSVAALVTGILGLSLLALYNFAWMPLGFLLSKLVETTNIMQIFIIPFIAIVLCLSIAAVVCGSIDLSRIKKGLYNNKGKGFDIAGIIMGGIVLLFAIVFILGEIIVPH